MAKVYDDQKGARDEWAKLKNEPLKKKLQYLATYYGLYAIGAAFLIVFLATFIPAYIDNRIPNVLAGEYLLTAPSAEGSEELRLYLCDKLGLPEKDYHISLVYRGIDSKDINQVQALYQMVFARIMAQDVDYYVGDEETLCTFMNPDDLDSDCFIDLREVLPPDLYETLEKQGRLKSYVMNNGTEIPYLIDPTDSAYSRLLSLDSHSGLIAIVANVKNVDAMIEVCRLIVE